ncbi:MAG: tRNA (adenosine(37)-N6)-threonylcarbamoyltransferase complex ATPase subunit type 1 TsaE [Paracoccaceae bacterium]
MRPPGSAEYLLCDEDQASRFGAALGRSLRAGDTVLLEGPVGAGKSHVARAAIRAIAGAATEVPSPSFTLVQTYPGPACEVWHADLYRLTSPEEVLELGLVDAMEEAIVLVEWPDRLGPCLPPHAIRLRLQPEGDARRALVCGARDELLKALCEAVR